MVMVLLVMGVMGFFFNGSGGRVDDGDGGGDGLLLMVTAMPLSMVVSVIPMVVEGCC